MLFLSNSVLANQMSQQKQRLIRLSNIKIFYTPVLVNLCKLYSCYQLTRESAFVVFCCCSFNMLYTQRRSSAYLLLCSCPTSLKQSGHSTHVSCCSHDIFSFLGHSLQTPEMTVWGNPRRSSVFETIRAAHLAPTTNHNTVQSHLNRLFFSHSDAQFEFHQPILSMSSCLKAVSCHPVTRTFLLTSS